MEVVNRSFYLSDWLHYPVKKKKTAKTNKQTAGFDQPSLPEFRLFHPDHLVLKLHVIKGKEKQAMICEIHGRAIIDLQRPYTTGPSY